jgi:hypothetical protein
MLDNSEWLAQQGLHTTPWECALETWHTSGEWRPPAIEFPARATA